MAWWDNLWLNEGFATWMESKATEHFHPRWQTWLNNYDEKQGAMRRMRNGTAHPIQPAGDRQVRSVGDVRRHHLQQGRRRRAHARRLSRPGRCSAAGVRKYLTDHAYGNTTPADLWRALEAVSGKPVDRRRDCLHRAERRPAGGRRNQCIDDEQRITLRQERFTLPGAEPDLRLLAYPNRGQAGAMDSGRSTTSC